MTTLIRLLVVLATFAGLAYGAMVLIVTYMKPQPREMTQTIKLPVAPRHAAGPE